MEVEKAVAQSPVMPKVTPRFRQKPQSYQRTFIRQWREYRGLTLEQVAERIGTTHATLSRVERQQSPYSQGMLEALANALSCTAADLLIRDPTDPEGIWSVWDHALPGQRQMIVDLAKTITKTGTDN